MNEEIFFKLYFTFFLFYLIYKLYFKRKIYYNSSLRIAGFCLLILLILDNLLVGFSASNNKLYFISIFIIIVSSLLEILDTQKNIQTSFYFKIGEIYLNKENSTTYIVYDIIFGNIEFSSQSDLSKLKLSFEDAVKMLKKGSLVIQKVE